MLLNFLNFEKILNNNFLYENQPQIVVGVSGGPDSLALVTLLNKWVKKKKGKLIALIVDHKIRKESIKESLQTKKFFSCFNKNRQTLFIFYII